MSIEIRQIDHVVVRAADAERAIGFYCEVLGCSVERRRDDLGLVHLRAGSCQIDIVDIDSEIGKRGGPAPGPGPNIDHFCVRLAAFDEAAIRAHLLAHDVEASAVETRFGAEGNGPSMYIKDPDGNTVELKGPPDG